MKLLPLLIISLFTFITACGHKNKPAAAAQVKKVRTAEDDKADSLLVTFDRKNYDPWIEGFVQNLHKQYNFNGNVLVAKDNKVIYEKAVGWADYLHRDSLKINSEFELASVSKPFTATAIMQLVEAGKLKLDDDVKKFFPDFPYDGITVKLLLSHRSGMMNYVYFVDKLWSDKRRGMSNFDVMKLIAQEKPTRYAKPNDRFHYNNSNFMVLGGIIQKVTGQTLAVYMMDHIFKPAGMKNTHVYSTTAFKKIPVDVVGHDRNNFKYSVAQNFLDGPVGDKGVYSTVHDLVLFDKALKNGTLLSKKSLDLMYTPHNPLIKGHFSYGYGWRLFVDPQGDQVVYHTGWWHGFRHIYVRDLTKNIIVIFLGNLTNASLLHLDDIYKHLDMPVIRKGAYTGATTPAGTDEE